jgi:hypothetical protein
LREGGGIAAKVLVSLGFGLEKTRNEILRELGPNHTPDAGRTQTGKVGGETTTTRDVNIDPNFDGPPEASTAAETESELRKGWWSSFPKPDPVDLSRRYDVYCIQHGEAVVYRNVLIKAVKGLFASHGAHRSSLYLELEQVDGKAIFLPKHSVFKFCDPGAAASGEPVA